MTSALRRWARRAAALVSVICVGAGAGACHSADADCSNGTCECTQGASCDFSCASSPCSVECDDNATCSAECADGNCQCDRGASCSFACNSGPCHVTCAGNNPTCSGACWDGMCLCGAGSSCSFRCASPPCHTECDPGSHCVVDCGANGNQCDITSCGSGSVTTCPDGHTLACNAACP